MCKAANPVQPAMDHVLENSEKPVPTAEEQNADAVDDDDDAEALAAHIKKTGASDEQIAKVGCDVTQARMSMAPGRARRTLADRSVHQVQRMRQGVPIAGDGELPRGEVRPPRVRRVDGRGEPGHWRTMCSGKILASDTSLTTTQIKPLTEEEKKAKLAELREKLAAKRAVQSKEDEKSARANEASRQIRIILRPSCWLTRTGSSTKGRSGRGEDQGGSAAQGDQQGGGAEAERWAL